MEVARKEHAVRIALRTAGVDSAKEGAFRNARRLEFISERCDAAEFEVVVDKAAFALRSAAMDIFGLVPERQMTNLYSLTEGAEMAGKGRGTSAQEMWKDTIGRSFGFLERQGGMGMEYTMVFEKQATGLVVDHAGTIAREGQGIRFEERQRTITTMVLIGDRIVFVDDALSVTFG